MKVVIYFLAFFIGVVLASDVDNIYNGAQVLSIVPKTQQEIEFLLEIESSDHFDIWKATVGLGRKTEILATRDNIEALKLLMNNNEIEYSVKIDNVGKMIQDSSIINEAARIKARLRGQGMEWTAYHDVDEIFAWMDEKAAEFPDIVTVSEIGRTYEGRPMKMLKISTGGKNKPIIFSEATIHAREWIAPATLTYIIEELLNNQTTYQDSLDAVDFHFVPVSNPDGYAYSWESENTRLWRKTRIPHDNDGCIGADPNRNFDFHWAAVGSSDRYCSAIYHGPHAFSENCTKALSDQILSEGKNTRVYIAFHSYAEEWLRPWGYIAEITEDEDDLSDLCERSVKAAFDVNQLKYKCVLSGKDYQAGGVTDDWAYAVVGVKYSYTIELRDQGAGFILPPEHIIPSGKEIFAAFQVVFEHVRDNPNDKREY